MIIRPRFSGSLIVLACMCLLQNAHAASIQRWQTAEGTTIYLAERHELPILDITVQFKGAGGADNINSANIAKAVTNMLTSGTKELDEEALNDRSNELAATFDSSDGIFSHICLLSARRPCIIDG